MSKKPKTHKVCHPRKKNEFVIDASNLLTLNQKLKQNVMDLMTETINITVTDKNNPYRILYEPASLPPNHLPVLEKDNDDKIDDKMENSDFDPTLSQPIATIFDHKDVISCRIVKDISPKNTLEENQYNYTYGELISSRPLPEIPIHHKGLDFYVLINKLWLKINLEKDEASLSYSVINGVAYVRSHKRFRILSNFNFVPHAGAPVYMTNDSSNIHLIGVVGRMSEREPNTYPILGPSGSGIGFEIPMRGKVKIFESFCPNLHQFEKSNSIQVSATEHALDIGLPFKSRVDHNVNNVDSVSFQQIDKPGETRLFIHQIGDTRVIVSVVLVREDEGVAAPNFQINRLFIFKGMGNYKLCYKQSKRVEFPAEAIPMTTSMEIVSKDKIDKSVLI